VPASIHLPTPVSNHDFPIHVAVGQGRRTAPETGGMPSGVRVFINDVPMDQASSGSLTMQKSI